MISGKQTPSLWRGRCDRAIATIKSGRVGYIIFLPAPASCCAMLALCAPRRKGGINPLYHQAPKNAQHFLGGSTEMGPAEPPGGWAYWRISPRITPSCFRYRCCEATPRPTKLNTISCLWIEPLPIKPSHKYYA